MRSSAALVAENPDLGGNSWRKAEGAWLIEVTSEVGRLTEPLQNQEPRRLCPNRAKPGAYQMSDRPSGGQDMILGVRGCLLSYTSLTT